LNQWKQAAVCKSWIIDCGKDKFITEIPEQEQNHQYDTYLVKGPESGTGYLSAKPFVPDLSGKDRCSGKQK
jgi:hypothetical protein